MKLLPLLIGIILFTSCSDNSEHDDLFVVGDLKLNSRKAIQKKGPLSYYKGKLFSGTILEKDSIDTIYHAPYALGLLHGTVINKRKHSIRFYQKGKKEGIHKAWWPNGNLKFEYHFKNDEHHGAMKQWYENGQLTKHFNYNMGHEEGSQKWYKKDGSIRSNYVVKNGRRYGLVGGKNCQTIYEEN